MKEFAYSASLLLVALAAHAQLRESTTVEVVEVPVYVSAHGAPVTALTRENFELFINGKRQPIEYFDTIDYAALSPEQSRDVRQRRLYMLVFDLLSPPNALQRAQKAAVRFIDDAAVNDTFAVALFGRSGLNVVVPFSRDRLALRRAIRNLDVSPVGDPLHLALTPGERGDEGGHPDRIRDPRFDDVFINRMEEREALIDDEIAYLGDLADRLSGMEGQKHVVLLSSGFDSAILTGIQSPRMPGDIRVGPLGSLNDLNRSMNSSAMVAPPNAYLLGALRGLHDRYAADGVFLDAIDIGGLRPMQRVWDNEALYALTRDTGGQVIDRRNDLASSIQLLTDLQRVVYILGFRAANTGRAENRIRVKLLNVRRGTHASYRPSYQSQADQPDSGDMLRLADIIVNDIPQNGVTTNVTAEAAARGASIEVALPGRELLAHAAGGFIGAKAMIYVMSGTSVVAFRIKRIEIDVSRAGASLRDSPIRLRDTFELPAGNYAAKALVRMDTTGALGFARTDFAVASP
jgi:VWFA-related protein